jgi:hypothetical protein
VKSRFRKHNVKAEEPAFPERRHSRRSGDFSLWNLLPMHLYEQAISFFRRAFARLTPLEMTPMWLRP